MTGSRLRFRVVCFNGAVFAALAALLNCGGIVGGLTDDDGGSKVNLLDGGPPTPSSTAPTPTTSAPTPTPGPTPTTTTTSTSPTPTPVPTPSGTATSPVPTPAPTTVIIPNDAGLTCGGGTDNAVLRCDALGCPVDSSLSSAITYFCGSQFAADRMAGGEMSVGCGVVTTFVAEGTTTIAYDATGTQIVAIMQEPEVGDATCTGPTDFVFPDCDTAVLVTSSSCH